MAHHGSCNISPHKQYDELSIRIILILSEKKYTCFRRYKCEHMMLMHVTEWWKTAATSFWHIPTKRISISRLLSIVSGNLKCTLSNTMNIMNSSSFASPAKLIRCATLVFRFGIGKRMNFNKKKIYGKSLCNIIIFHVLIDCNWNGMRIWRLHSFCMINNDDI